MKFVSLLLILFLVGWSFNLGHREREVPLAVHGFLVRELKNAMVNNLESNIPQVSQITFYRMFTEVVVPGERIKAFVKYSYDSVTESGLPTRELREGEFDLTSSDGGQTWEPRAKNFRDVNLEFLDGLRVTPGEDTEDLEDPLNSGSEETRLDIEEEQQDEEQDEEPSSLEL